MEVTNWASFVDELERNPEKARAWILSLLFKAGIKPTDRVAWSITEGRIVIGRFEK